MPPKGKGQKLEVKGGAKASKGGASSFSSSSKQKQEKLDLDEIARACLEIEEQVAWQESRPKNIKKKAAREKNEVEKSSVKENKEEEKEVQGGEGVQQLCELNMTGEGYVWIATEQGLRAANVPTIHTYPTPAPVPLT